MFSKPTEPLGTMTHLQKHEVEAKSTTREARTHTELETEDKEYIGRLTINRRTRTQNPQFL